MTTLKELIVKRPSRQFQYLHVLLDLSSHEKEKVALASSQQILSLCLKETFIYAFFVPGANHCPGFSEAHV